MKLVPGHLGYVFYGKSVENVSISNVFNVYYVENVTRFGVTDQPWLGRFYISL